MWLGLLRGGAQVAAKIRTEQEESAGEQRPQLLVGAEESRCLFVLPARGKAPPMGRGSLQLLLTIIAPRLKPEGEGYVPDPAIAYPMAVHRLRKTLDAAIGPGAGRMLIEIGIGLEYGVAPEESAALDARVMDMDVAAAPDMLDWKSCGSDGRWRKPKTTEVFSDGFFVLNVKRACKMRSRFREEAAQCWS
jgi:hypothetical protein